MINPFFNRQPLGSSEDIGYQIRPSTARREVLPSAQFLSFNTFLSQKQSFVNASGTSVLCVGRVKTPKFDRLLEILALISVVLNINAACQPLSGEDNRENNAARF
jgi:hypothetical protein